MTRAIRVVLVDPFTADDQVGRGPQQSGSTSVTLAGLSALRFFRSRRLEHLRLLLRGGENLEVFYSRLGWTEIGRHPQALRISSGDDRDEVSMMLRLTGD